VRGVVVVDQPPDPAGQLGVDALEQLFDGVRVDPFEPRQRCPPDLP
jgi:hypothetical protein